FLSGVPFLSFLAPGKDSGGLFRGRPGVDKNIVRLSDMEYVVNARATQQWLPLLEAINNNKMRGFSNGGLNTPGNYSPGFRLNDQVVQLNIKLEGKEEWSARKLK